MRHPDNTGQLIPTEQYLRYRTGADDDKIRGWIKKAGLARGKEINFYIGEGPLAGYALFIQCVPSSDTPVTYQVRFS
jgi:hypothetical protein